MEGDYTEPAWAKNLFHNGADGSWYPTSGFGVFGFDVGHVVDYAGNSISSHIDQFGPFNPLHAISAAAAKLFGTTWSYTYICSPTDGCH